MKEEERPQSAAKRLAVNWRFGWPEKKRGRWEEREREKDTSLVTVV